MQSGAYNSRIPNMVRTFPSRLVGSIVFVLALLLNARVNAQNWAQAEEQLAGKIVSATGPKIMAVEVLNRSSLSAATADDIRRNLLTQLAVLGARFAAPEQAAATVRVSLSEDLQSYVWIAEIRAGCEFTFDRHGFPAAIGPAHSRIRSRGVGDSQNSVVVAGGAHSGCCGDRRESRAHAGTGCKQRDLLPPSG